MAVHATAKPSQTHLAVVIAVAGGLGLGRGAAAQCLYDIAFIVGPPCPPFPGASPVILTGIGDDGAVAGYYTPCAGNEKPFVWTPATGMIELSFPPGSYAHTNGIQSLTGFCGWFNAPDDGLGNIGFAAVGASMQVLGTLPGGNSSEAKAMRDGVVVGWWGNTVSEPPATPQAFLWHDGSMTNLSPDLGKPQSDARDINASGEITGGRGNSYGFDGSAYVLVDGVALTIPMVGNWTWSSGNALNNRGDVAGSGKRLNPQTVETETRGFVWIDGEFAVIDPLPGAERSACLDINENRLVVGNSWGESPNITNTRGIVWQNGVTRNLNDLIASDAGVVIYHAWSINNAGQVAAGGFSTKYFGNVGMVLTPQPAPLGDLDGDCQVGIRDFLELLEAWGACPAGCPADLNGDGAVGATDLQMLLLNWS